MIPFVSEGKSKKKRGSIESEFFVRVGLDLAVVIISAKVKSKKEVIDIQNFQNLCFFLSKVVQFLR